MTTIDIAPPFGIPRPELNAISKLAAEILALSGPSGPRLVTCWDGSAEPLGHDELEWLHNQIDGYGSDDWVPRLLATVEALRVQP